MSSVSVYYAVKFYEETCEDRSGNIAVCRIEGIFVGVSDAFITGGYLTHSSMLEKQEKDGKDFVRTFEKLEHYAVIEGDCSQGISTINFLGGSAASAVGDIWFYLNDDQTYQFSIPILEYGGATTRVDLKKNKCESLRNIVLGLGQVLSAEYERERARFWSFEIGKEYVSLTGIEADQDTLQGFYRGNNKDNLFGTVAGNKLLSLNPNCEKLDKHSELYDIITNYGYTMYGMDGDDTFMIGPQGAKAIGGNGKDFYIVYSTGGDFWINNYAKDGQLDTLLLNVTYKSSGRDSITCKRHWQDFEITYCGDRKVVIQYWFTDAAFQHMEFRSRDGIIFKEFQVSNDSAEIECLPVGMDYSRSEQIEVIELNNPMFRKVSKVIGPSNHASHIEGNEHDNILICMYKECTVQGNEGHDTYVFYGNGSILINNCDPSESRDIDYLNINDTLGNITLIKRRDQLRVIAKGRNQVYGLFEWFAENEKCNHLLISTADNEIFEIKQTSSGEVFKLLLILDFSDSETAVVVDLSRGTAPGIPPETDTSAVTTIISSIHADQLEGNVEGNMFKCNGKGVTMSGGGGDDMYFITKECSAIIDTCSYDDDIDRVLLPCKYLEMSICQEEDDLKITCSEDETTEPCAGENEVKMKKWKSNEDCRTFNIISKDGFHLETGSFSNEGSGVSKYSRVIGLRIEIKNNSLCCDLDLADTKLDDIKSLVHVSKFELDVPDSNFKIRGNAKDNSISIGKRNSDSSTHIEGRDGSDYYILQSNTGLVILNNSALDIKEDILKLAIPFNKINISHPNSEGSVLIFSDLSPENDKIILHKYWNAKTNQHLVIISEDQIYFTLCEESPYKKVKAVSKERSPYPEVVQLPEEYEFQTAEKIQGSHEASNIMFGTSSTKSLTGGAQPDYLAGGPGNEVIGGLAGGDVLKGYGGDDFLVGGSGADILRGGEGDDVLHGGLGPDVIDGGPGTDTATFEGVVTKDVDYHGVEVNLFSGVAKYGDAENDYLTGIETIVGTLYNDTLEDDDGDNALIGGPGEDILIAHNGIDHLSGGPDKDIYIFMAASGQKKIDNYENDTDLENDEILLVAEESQSGQEIIKCAYQYFNDLYLVIKDSFVIVLLNFFLGPLYQHISINTGIGLPFTFNELVPMTKLVSMILISMEAKEVSTESLKLAIDCKNCKVVLVCEQLVASGETSKLATKPNKISGITAEIKRGSREIFMRWSAASQDDALAADQYGYEAKLSIEIKTDCDESKIEKSLIIRRLIFPFMNIRVPVNILEARIEIKVQAVAHGTRSDWSSLKTFVFKKCQDQSFAGTKTCFNHRDATPELHRRCLSPAVNNRRIRPIEVHSNQSLLNIDSFSWGRRIRVMCQEGFEFQPFKVEERLNVICFNNGWHPVIPHCTQKCVSYKTETSSAIKSHLYSINPTCPSKKFDIHHSPGRCYSEQREKPLCYDAEKAD